MPEGAGNDKDHTKTRYEGAAEMIKRERWTADYGLPAKYYKTLLNFPKVTHQEILQEL